MNALRASLAAVTIAIAGLAAGTASAKPVNLPLGPNKLVLKLCKPHLESHSRYLGIRKIGFRYYRVYRVTVVHVHANCTRHIVRVHYRYVPLPFFFKKAAPGV
jgi:hypothetical protein